MTSINSETPYPGIHRIKLPLAGSPLKYVNAYLLPSDSGHLLIDTGWKTEDTQDALMQQIQALGLNATDIRHIWVTHTHIDHYGLAAKLIKRFDAQLIMHALEEKIVALRYGNPYQYTRQTNALLKSAGAAQWLFADTREVVERFALLAGTVLPDSVVHGGETLRHGRFSFEVLWTPGHSPGHICLYEPHHQIMFSGDHVLPGITPNIGVFPQSGPNPLDDYTRSLKRIRHLDVRLTLPAHGPLLTGFTRRVDQILAHHEKRNIKILHIFSESTDLLSAYALAQRIQWYSKRKPIEWQDLGAFDQRLAISEMSAALANLTGQGRLIKNSSTGLDTYRLATAPLS